MTVTAAAARTCAPPGYLGHKADQLVRLARIEGQVRGVARMVDDDRYCTDGPKDPTPRGYTMAAWPETL
jgi:hypothetical protein